MNRADSAPADFPADAGAPGAFDDADVGELAPAAVGFTPGAQKGRGAVGNPAGRYEPETRHAADDGWGVNPADESAPLRTVVTEESPRRALNYNQSPDIGFDRSINPYRGCEHGCVYCYARPSHSYLGLSPGLDFESRLFAKGDIAKVLERELRKPGYQARPVMLGANTDCYQPLERERGLTRKVLEVLDAFNHPAVVVTKSTGVTRDLDILSRMAARNLARAAVSVTTLDADLARNLEPRAAAPPKRLETIRALADAGVPVTVMAAPIIPCLNDHELEAILQASADAGACGAGMTLLRLPYELKDLFVEWLDAHAPLKKDRVLSHIRAMRGGQLYVADFKTRRKGEGVYADLLQRRFRLAVERFGLNRRRADTVTKMDISAFAAPFESGAQMAFL